MTPAEAAKILKRHNAWRRDQSDHPEDVLEMVDPKVLGVAIDVAVACLDIVDIARGATPVEFTDLTGRGRG